MERLSSPFCSVRRRRASRIPTAWRKAAGAVAAAALLMAAQTAAADESGTFRMLRSYRHSYVTIDHGVESFTGGTLQGTYSIIASSGAPFVDGVHGRSECLVYSRTAADGISPRSAVRERRRRGRPVPRGVDPGARDHRSRRRRRPLGTARRHRSVCGRDRTLCVRDALPGRRLAGHGRRLLVESFVAYLGEWRRARPPCGRRRDETAVATGSSRYATRPPYCFV